MQQNVKFFEIPLFFGFSEEELYEILELLEAERITYEAEKIILHEGDLNSFICVILSGEANAVKYDLSGREAVYTKLTSGSIFGDVLAVSADRVSPVTVRAFAGTEILKFRFESLVAVNGNNPELRVRLLRNLTAELAQKFFDLQDRVNCLVCPTLREKILTFLDSEVKKQKGINFNIAMDRERLAAYLNTDRSALSRELSKLKKEGLIDFYKNSFKMIIERDSI